MQQTGILLQIYTAKQRHLLPSFTFRFIIDSDAIYRLIIRPTVSISRRAEGAVACSACWVATTVTELTSKGESLPRLLAGDVIVHSQATAPNRIISMCPMANLADVIVHSQATAPNPRSHKADACVPSAHLLSYHPR